jgi:hypothetical protein
MNRAKNKVRNYTFAILLLSVYSIVCKAQNRFVKNRSTFSVSIHLKKTYLKVNVGDVVQVTASGKMVFHGITGSAGPEGIDGFTDRCMDPVFPFGALLYKVGNDDWVMADPDNPLTADQTGYLKLMVNDNDPSANRGRFMVKVTVTSSKANGGHQIANRPAPKKAKNNIATIPHAGAVPEKPKNVIAPIPHSTAVAEKAKDQIPPAPHSTAVPEKAKNIIPPISHSAAVPEKAKDNKTPAPHPGAAVPAKAKDNIAPTPNSVVAPEKAKDNIALTPHSMAAPEKAKNNTAPIPHSTAVSEKPKDNIPPIPHSMAGILTLSELQQLSSHSAKAAKAFLTSKHFRVDTESNNQTNKYDFNNLEVTAYVTKYIEENQATFSTSSAYNYEAIKASLNKYRYTSRELVTKAEGVTKYANSKYSMSIVLSQLNNKPQYLFVVKRL